MAAAAVSPVLRTACLNFIQLTTNAVNIFFTSSPWLILYCNAKQCIAVLLALCFSMKSPPQEPARPRSARSRARPLGETLGDSIGRKSIGLDSVGAELRRLSKQ
jgi:hypothetical protein